MAGFTQAGRRLRIDTPLGVDALLLTRLQATEGLSTLFKADVELLAANDTDVDYAKLIGKPATVAVDRPGAPTRYIAGIVSSVVQRDRDDVFTHYAAEIVPDVYKLTLKTQSRVFQEISAVDVVKAVLAGYAVDYRLVGQYPAHNHCVQYRESD
ncbi:MAG: contractile injection system protein, VgrG/Pvc8 family, partial [Planctomycetia bacterium]